MNKIIFALLIIMIVTTSGCLKDEEGLYKDGDVIVINESHAIITVHRLFNAWGDSYWAVDFVDDNTQGMSTISELNYQHFGGQTPGKRLEFISHHYEAGGKEELILVKMIYRIRHGKGYFEKYYNLYYNENTSQQTTYLGAGNGF